MARRRYSRLFRGLLGEFWHVRGSGSRLTIKRADSQAELCRGEIQIGRETRNTGVTQALGDILLDVNTESLGASLAHFALSIQASRDMTHTVGMRK